jgi:hypothetical protein
MEEHGISKIVSVKFHKNQDGATAQPARLLEKPAADSVAKEEDTPHKQAETLEVGTTN